MFNKCIILNNIFTMKKVKLLALFIVLTFNISFATEQQNVDELNKVVETDNILIENTSDNLVDTMDVNITEHVDDAVEKTGVDKDIKLINVLDVVGDENISPEMRKRITKTLNKAQYEFDKYESYINNHTKSTDNKFINVEKEINDLKTFTEELEANFDLAKWMVISLSVGIVCLATIITMMWKGVVNVNRNDVEVLYSIERIKKDLRSLEKRVEMLETAYKNEKR